MKCLVKEAMMNITKRMLRFGAVAVAVAIGCNAMAAGLAVPFGESFEAIELLNQKATTLTDWSGGVDDASIITNVTYAFAKDIGGTTAAMTPPLGFDTPHTQVLKLNTEGGTLSAALDDSTQSTAKFDTQSIYVDAMINMVISEDDPSFTGMDDIKIEVADSAQQAGVERCCDSAFRKHNQRCA